LKIDAFGGLKHIGKNLFLLHLGLVFYALSNFLLTLVGEEVYFEIRISARQVSLLKVHFLEIFQTDLGLLNALILASF
jgi:hypothetical protein